MLLYEQYENGMKHLASINIGPYVKVRKGSKVNVNGKWLEKALVYVDQRDVFEMLNVAFGVGKWASNESVAPDGKSVIASFEFPVMLGNQLYVHKYSAVADLITNTKSLKDGGNLTAQALANMGIELTYVGNDKVAVVDSEEAIKGAASRAAVRAATKFMPQIANLYTYKNLYYSENGKAPDLSKIDFSVQIDTQEEVIATPSPVEIAKVTEENNELRAIELKVSEIKQALGTLADTTDDKVMYLKNAINKFDADAGTLVTPMDNKQTLAFLKEELELEELEMVLQIVNTMIAELVAQAEPAKPVKKSSKKVEHIPN